MTALYFHRGVADGQFAEDTGADPAATVVTVTFGNGTAEATYRRTDYFRDGLRIYMPAALVNPDGSLA